MRQIGFALLAVLTLLTIVDVSSGQDLAFTNCSPRELIVNVRRGDSADPWARRTIPPGATDSFLLNGIRVVDIVFYSYNEDGTVLSFSANGVVIARDHLHLRTAAAGPPEKRLPITLTGRFGVLQDGLRSHWPCNVDNIFALPVVFEKGKARISFSRKADAPCSGGINPKDPIEPKYTPGPIVQ